MKTDHKSSPHVLFDSAHQTSWTPRRNKKEAVIDYQPEYLTHSKRHLASKTKELYIVVVSVVQPS